MSRTVPGAAHTRSGLSGRQFDFSTLLVETWNSMGMYVHPISSALQALHSFSALAQQDL